MIMIYTFTVVLMKRFLLILPLATSRPRGREKIRVRKKIFRLV